MLQESFELCTSVLGDDVPTCQMARLALARSTVERDGYEAALAAHAEVVPQLIASEVGRTSDVFLEELLWAGLMIRDGRLDEARTHLQQTLHRVRDVDNADRQPLIEAQALAGLIDIALEQSDRDEARRNLGEARSLVDHGRISEERFLAIFDAANLDEDDGSLGF